MAASRLTRLVAAATALGWATLLTVWAGQVMAPASAHASASRKGAIGRLASERATRRALAAQYLAIARAGNKRLEHDFDALEGRDRNNLAAARADLRDAAATERLFDRRLLHIAFPARTERVARRLYRLNQIRAGLTAVGAAFTSLRVLHAFERQLDAANVPVEQAVATLRQQLGLPPPSTS